MFITLIRARGRTAARLAYAVLAGLAATAALVTLEGPAALAAPGHNVIPPGGAGLDAPAPDPTVIHVTSGFATWQVAWIAAAAAILAAAVAIRFDRSRTARLAVTD